MSHLAHRVAYLGVSAAVVTLDQITKALVAARIPFHGEVPLLPGFLSLRHGRNPGVAFGLLSSGDLPYQAALLTGVTCLALVALLVWSFRVEPRPWTVPLALALVIGGAAGNLVDRVRTGAVLDFVHAYWGRYQWPDFNVADSAISVGIVLLLFSPRRAASDTLPRPPQG